MPQTVRQVEQPPPVITLENSVLLGQIGEVRHFCAEPSSLRSGDTVTYRPFDFSKVTCERQLLFIGDILVMENQHRVTVHSLVDRIDVCGREWLAEIDTLHLANKVRMELADRDSHLTILLGHPGDEMIGAKLRTAAPLRCTSFRPRTTRGDSLHLRN